MEINYLQLPLEFTTQKRKRNWSTLRQPVKLSLPTQFRMHTAIWEACDLVRRYTPTGAGVELAFYRFHDLRPMHIKILSYKEIYHP